MLELTIPGQSDLQLEHLVLDYNGTLAIDGQLIAGVAERLATLAESLTVHVVTADTFGTVRDSLAGVPCQVAVLPAGQPQDSFKQDYVQQLGLEQTAAIGNGLNDHLMLDAAAFSVVVLQNEGAAVETLLAADVAAPDILAALDLLLRPKRLAATLRV